MANEKKTETPKTETRTHSSEALVDPNEGVMHLERIAVALERLADAFAPRRSNTAPGRPMARTCENGHGMQGTDDYCQACHAEMRGAKLPVEAA